MFLLKRFQPNMISLNKIKILFLELKSNKYQPTELFYEVRNKTYLTGNKKKQYETIVPRKKTNLYCLLDESI